MLSTRVALFFFLLGSDANASPLPTGFSDSYRCPHCSCTNIHLWYRQHPEQRAWLICSIFFLFGSYFFLFLGGPLHSDFRIRGGQRFRRLLRCVIAKTERRFFFGFSYDYLLLKKQPTATKILPIWFADVENIPLTDRTGTGRGMGRSHTTFIHSAVKDPVSNGSPNFFH